MRKFEGFDFLRAIFSIAIVADHTDVFTLATIYGVSSITDLLYANFSYIAVPVFFQISLFLFFLKSEKVEFNEFVQNRMIRLISLYLFWVISLVLFKLFFKEGGAGMSKLGSLSIRGWIEFIVSGGNSPFYFFFSLIFVTTLAALLVLFFKKTGRYSRKIGVSYWLFFISCILIFSFSIIDPILTIIYVGNRESSIILTVSNIVSWNYNPLNFLPYIFTATIAVQEFDRGKLNQMSSRLKFKLWSLFALFLIFTLLEWLLLDRLIHYSRLSLVFGSWLLLYLALLSTYKAPDVVSFISEYSLGIYAIHLFFTHVFFADNPNFLTVLSDRVPGLDLLAEFLLVFSGSIAITFIFKKIEGLKTLV
jgi:hypothetical protein